MVCWRRASYWVGMVVLLQGGVVWGHDSMESTVSVWVRGTGLDVQIYVSRGAAADLIVGQGDVGGLTIVRDNFEKFARRLSAAGPGLLTVAVGDGGAIKADSSVATITEEDDVCFALHFPVPSDVVVAGGGGGG